MFTTSRMARAGLALAAILVAATAVGGTTGTYMPIGQFGSNQANQVAEFGTSMSVSGSFIAIGLPHADVSGSSGAPDVGRVNIFRNENGVWIENSSNVISVPIANLQTGMEFGAAVALSGGDLMVGAPGETVNGLANAGAVYFYRRDENGIWQFRDRNDSGIIQAEQRFGASVALTGTYAAAGAPLYNQTSQNPDTGRVTLYLRSSAAGDYLQNGGEFTPVVEGFETFGSALHFQDFLIGTDRLFIGAPNRIVQGMSLVGSAYFYERIAGDWALQQTFAPAIAVGDLGGSAIRTSGNTLFISARGRDAPGGIASAGSVRVYLLGSDGFYDFDDELFAPNAQASAFFGSSLAASGNRLVVGAPRHNDGPVDSGQAYVFETQTVAGDTFYVPRAQLALAEAPAAGDRLGTAVAVAGNVVFAAAPHRTVRGFPNAGQVQFYDNERVFSDGFEGL